MKLEKNFFLVDGVTLAKNLLGKVLVRKILRLKLQIRYRLAEFVFKKGLRIYNSRVVQI